MSRPAPHETRAIAEAIDDLCQKTSSREKRIELIQRELSTTYNLGKRDGFREGTAKSRGDDGNW